MDVKLITTDAVQLLDNLKSNFKKIKEAFVLVSTGGGGGGTTGAIVDGGSPSTNHVGNLKIDFGSVQ